MLADSLKFILTYTTFFIRQKFSHLQSLRITVSPHKRNVNIFGNTQLWSPFYTRNECFCLPEKLPQLHYAILQLDGRYHKRNFALLDWLPLNSPNYHHNFRKQAIIGRGFLRKLFPFEENCIKMKRRLCVLYSLIDFWNKDDVSELENAFEFL
jgi:hypothetical protein